MWTSGSSDCSFIPFLRIWKCWKRAELCFRATSMPPDAVARLAVHAEHSLFHQVHDPRSLLGLVPVLTS